MSKIPTNINPTIYTLSATLIGFALLDDFSSAEQNALANWFLLIGQVLETNSAFKGLNGNNSNNNESADSLDNIEKTLKIMQEEIDKLKR